MFYIFNSETRIVGWCDLEPNKEDLDSRLEFYVESEDHIENPMNIIVGKYGSIFEPAPNNKTEEENFQDTKNILVAKRDLLLSQTDWIVNRHLEQKMLNIVTSFSDEQFNSYLVYRQELRDTTSNIDFPFAELPAPPETK